MPNLGKLNDYIPYRLYFTLRRVLKNREFTQKMKKNNPYYNKRGKKDLLEFKKSLIHSKTLMEIDTAIYGSKIMAPYKFFEKHPEFEDMVNCLTYTKDWEKRYVIENCPNWEHKLIKIHMMNIDSEKLKNLEFL